MALRRAKPYSIRFGIRITDPEIDDGIVVHFTKVVQAAPSGHVLGQVRVEHGHQRSMPRLRLERRFGDGQPEGITVEMLVTQEQTAETLMTAVDDAIRRHGMAVIGVERLAVGASDSLSL